MEDLLLDNWCDGKLEVPPVKFHSHGSRADQKVPRRPMNSVKAQRAQANLDSSRGSCKNARQLIRAYSIPLYFAGLFCISPKSRYQGAFIVHSSSAFVKNGVQRDRKPIIISRSVNKEILE